MCIKIYAAIKVAQEKTQVQLSRDLVEYMASKGKNSTTKAKVEFDLPYSLNHFSPNEIKSEE